MPVIRSTNFSKDGRLDLEDTAARAIPMRDITRKILLDGDIVLERSGGGPGQPVGRLVRVNGLKGAYCSNFCQQLRADPEIVDPGFLYRLLWKLYEDGITERLQHQTTGIRNLDYSGYLSHTVYLPPLPEQRAIAAVLDAIDEAIEQTEAVIAATERLREALLQELLTRGVPGWHEAWKHVPGIGTMPGSWSVTRLGGLASFITSGSRAWSPYFSGNGALFVRSQNIVDGSIDQSDPIYVLPPDDAEARRTRIRLEDVLVSITGEPGNVTVADDSLGDAYVSQHVALCRISEGGSLARFVGLFLQGRLGRVQFRKMQYGQTRPGLNLTNIAELIVAIPANHERERIVDLARSQSELQRNLADELGRLRDLKVAAAHGLLTGRVRVRTITEA